jgi:hypothetical protein
MSGSLTWREYESDHGVKYSIKVDKSNANLRGAYSGLILCKPREVNLKLPPKTLVLRRIHCFAQYNPNIRRSFICGNKEVIKNPNMEIGQEYITDLADVAGSISIPVWIVTGYVGERFTVPTYYYQIDTGLNDGSIYNY